ncbi:major facilitator superfamily domain-containing protein [Phyllosticta citribraziliensis]|uniref:Major facilitator superfamily domain-containing protein n=1 Tax=Phyllosticta citribraziliensis TaxID=989973 RepID=A0ABR1LKL4_9PEZI
MAARQEKPAEATIAPSEVPSLPSNHSNNADPPESVVEPVQEPPNGGYGWICCIATFWINAHTWGINSSYGIFLAHYLRQNTFPGATRLAFALVGGLSISQALFVSPLATATTRRFGTRVTLLVGVFFETLALICASFASQIWHLFLTQGVCFGWGMGFLFVGSVGVVPQWFTTRRSFANGIAASGSGVGGLTYSLATNTMIERIGLGWAFRVLGICAFSVNTVCALVIKDRNKHIGSSQLAFDYRLFKRPEFLLLLAFGFLSMLGYIVLLFSLPNYATSIGLSAHQGSVVGAMLNLGQALGRSPIGYFSDVIGRLNMAASMTLLVAVFSFAIWIPAKSYGVLLLFALLCGTVAGTYWAVVAPVTTEAVGLATLPAALSITWLVLVLPTTFSEAIALQITASNGGNYLGAQLFTAFMYLGAAAVMWMLRAWKIGQLERTATAGDNRIEAVDPVTEQPKSLEKNGKVLKPGRSFVERLYARARV